MTNWRRATWRHPLHSRADAKVVLQVEGLTRAGAYRDVSLDVRGGEVLGVYGFMGSGQLELARCLFGKSAGRQRTHRLDGKRARAQHDASAPRRDRVRAGKPAADAVRAEPVFKNVTISMLGRSALSGCTVGRTRDRAAPGERLRSVRPTWTCPSALSGGNQQKVALANGWPICHGCWCSASRRAAWMSAPRTT